MGWKELSKDRVINLLKRDLMDNASALLKGDRTLINSSMPKEIVAISNELFTAFEAIKKKGVQPLFLGEGVCDTENLKTARLNVQLAYRAAKLDLPKVYIKPKGEQLFLYARDIISDSVDHVEGELRDKGVILVLNQDSEFLGLGFSRGKLIGKGKSTVVLHVIDIGYYLRIERNK